VVLLRRTGHSRCHQTRTDQREHEAAHFAAILRYPRLRAL
jgi:hypothetical protein